MGLSHGVCDKCGGEMAVYFGEYLLDYAVPSDLCKYCFDHSDIADSPSVVALARVQMGRLGLWP